MNLAAENIKPYTVAFTNASLSDDIIAAYIPAVSDLIQNYVGSVAEEWTETVPAGVNLAAAHLIKHFVEQGDHDEAMSSESTGNSSRSLSNIGTSGFPKSVEAMLNPYRRIEVFG